MASVLVLYSTVDGHTRRICERICEVIDEAGHATTLLSLAEHEDADVSAFDAAIIGASVRYGRHRPSVGRFIARNAASLGNMPAALFSVNLVARNPAKCTPAGNPYMRKLLRRIPSPPKILEVFAGRLDYPRYTMWDRLIIKLIMKMTRGPTDVDTVEYTDWTQVEAFGRRMARIIGGGG